MKNLDNILKFGKNILVGTFIGASLIGGYGCTNPDSSPQVRSPPPTSEPVPTPSPEPQPQKYALGNPQNKNLLSGLNFPYGVSISELQKKSAMLATESLVSPSIGASSQTQVSQIYINSPVFPKTDDYYISSPTIKNVSGTLSDILGGVSQPLDIFNFGFEDSESFKHLSIVDPRNPDPDARIQIGLIVETAVSSDGSIYLITNNSNTLFRVRKDAMGNFTKDNFLVNDELYGTTNIMMGQDGKLYLAQKKIVDNGNPDTNTIISTSRKNRIVRIEDDLSISEIAKMPYDGAFFKSARVPADNALYSNQFIINEDIMKITEDTDNFYFMDRLGGYLYSILKLDNSVNVLKNDLDNPYFLKIDSDGKLVYMTALYINSGSPILHTGEPLTISQNPRVIRYDATTGLEEIVSEIPSNDPNILYDYISTMFLYTNKGNIPLPYIISGDIYEDASTWNVFYTDNIYGQSNVLTADKIPITP